MIGAKLAVGVLLVCVATGAFKGFREDGLEGAIGVGALGATLGLVIDAVGAALWFIVT